MRSSLYKLWNKYNALEEIAYEELKRAVMAHGGSFRFMTDDGETVEGVDSVIVCAAEACAETPQDYYVTHVEVDKDGKVIIFGKTKLGFWSEERPLEYIEHGHVMHITDVIPETDEVQDVSLSEEEQQNIFNSFKAQGL